MNAKEGSYVTHDDDVSPVSFLFSTANAFFFCGFLCQEKTSERKRTPLFFAVLLDHSQLSLLPHSFPNRPHHHNLSF